MSKSQKGKTRRNKAKARATIPRRGHLPKGTRRRRRTRTKNGIGVERTQVENAKSGVVTASPKECTFGTTEATNKRKGDDKSDKDKKHESKKLKIAKAYVAKIEKQQKEDDPMQTSDSE